MPSPAPDQVPAPTASALKRSTLLTLCACVLVAQSMVAAINLLIPQLSSSSLHPSSSELLWTVDAYVIVFASLLIPAGALGDRHGHKGALLTGLGLFAAGAATSALAQGPALLVAGRGISGAGAALITPATMSILMRLAGPGGRARAMASWTLAIGLGGMLGNLGGGLVGQFLTWRALFALMVPLAALLAVTVALTTPRTDRAPRQRLAPLGTLLLTAGLVATLFGIIEGPVHGWTSRRILTAFAAGAVLLAAFTAHSLRSRAPLLDPPVRLAEAALHDPRHGDRLLRPVLPLLRQLAVPARREGLRPRPRRGRDPAADRRHGGTAEAGRALVRSPHAGHRRRTRPDRRRSARRRGTAGTDSF